MAAPWRSRFALAGKAVATVTGLEAAFRWETRTAELRVLATSSQATVRRVDSAWQTTVAGAGTEDEQVAALQNLIALQDSELAGVQERAAALGVVVTDQSRRPMTFASYTQPESHATVSVAMPPTARLAASDRGVTPWLSLMILKPLQRTSEIASALKHTSGKCWRRTSDSGDTKAQSTDGFVEG